MPNCLGKQVTVLVFAQGDDAEAAREAGADFVADSEDIVNKIQGGWTELTSLFQPQYDGNRWSFRPNFRPQLMPKAGTVVQGDNIADAIKEAKSWSIEVSVR